MTDHFELKSLTMKEKLRTILEYLLVFLIILEFNTPYLVFNPIKRAVQIFPVIILALLILMSNYSIKKKVNAHVLTYLSGAIFPMLILKNSGYVTYVGLFFGIIPLLWIYLYLRKNEGEGLSLFLKFSNLMVIEAVISLIMWILCTMMNVIPMTLMIPYEWAPGVDFIPTYFGIYFETQGIRNTGIFNEGPMHNMALCVALLIECFLRQQKSKAKILILVGVIITTFTTTGQFLLIFLGAYFFLKNANSRRRIVVILLAPILLFGVYLSSNYLMETKMERDAGAGSVDERGKDIKNCIEIGLENPVLGVGMITKDKLSKVAKRGNAGYSNSTFTVFARGGFYCLTLYLVSLLLIPFLYSRKFHDNRYILMMLFFFFLFTLTISFLKYLTFLFMAFGLSNINLKKWTDNDENSLSSPKHLISEDESR